MRSPVTWTTTTRPGASSARGQRRKKRSTRSSRPCDGADRPPDPAAVRRKLPDFDPGLVSVGQVAGGDVFLRAPAEPVLAGAGGGAGLRTPDDDRGKEAAGADAPHRALGHDRQLRDRGLERQLHPRRGAERSDAHSPRRGYPADLLQRRHVVPVFPPLPAAADRPRGRQAPLDQPGQRCLERRAPDRRLARDPGGAKLGLVPYGEIRELKADDPTLTFNTIGRHISHMAYTRVTSTKSPWFSSVNAGDVFSVPISHGEGRFVVSDEMLQKLIANGQIATQYVDLNGKQADTIEFNPNGSVCAIEGITSPDGRVLGKMGHSERKGDNLYKNVPFEKDQKIFESGVKYFK